VDWRPVTGAIPPITEADWQVELEKYRTSPQYKLVNKGMTIDEFKGIFWLEYLHRLLARVLGFCFLLPFVYFAVRRAFSKPFAFRMLGIFALGGMQGLVGWLMVKSGLQNDPWVSPVKLMFHLGLATIIFLLLLWTCFSVRRMNEVASISRNSGWHYGIAVGICVMLYIQILLGALVAGNDAGLTYNSFPLMDGQFIPDGLWDNLPMWSNFVGNITMVQYNHRIMAYVLSFVIVLFCWQGLKRYPQFATWYYAVLTCFIAQFMLGVFTLLLVVPISLAVLHQANAMLLMGFCLKIVFLLRHEAQPVKENTIIHKPLSVTP
jgi:cytochrome c oxidase assembly protein subunit 15